MTLLNIFATIIAVIGGIIILIAALWKLWRIFNGEITNDNHRGSE